MVDSYQDFWCNLMLLARIKGTFDGEEDHRQKRSAQSIMHCIIGYYCLSVSGIPLSNWKFGILLNLPNWNTLYERYIKFIYVMKQLNTVDFIVSKITYEYQFAYSLQVWPRFHPTCGGGKQIRERSIST